MPYQFDQPNTCPACPFGFCIEDRRVNRVRGRETQFRLKQNTALHCTFQDFIPGSDGDPDTTRTFQVYLDQFRANARGAGGVLFPGGAFELSDQALAKVEGDVYELMQAAAIWNACAVWNRYMDTGVWDSVNFTVPEGAVATPMRKVAVIKLPRGYDTTKLFRPEVRATIKAHEESLRLRGMELGLSSPDLVGVRVPHPAPAVYAPFLSPLANLREANRMALESAYQMVEGTLDARAFLFAIAVKRTTRSDRLYQPLFEANILKYLIQEVLRGSAFRFTVHMQSFEGAAVEKHYEAASLPSLMRGGEPTRAIDAVYLSERPRDSAQQVLKDLPLFPL